MGDRIAWTVVAIVRGFLAASALMLGLTKLGEPEDWESPDG